MLRQVAQFIAAIILLSGSIPAAAAHAFAWANAGKGIAYYWAVNQPSAQEAGQRVVKLCNDSAKKRGHTGKCTLAASSTGPRYLAIFVSNNGKAFGAASSQDRQEAIDDAYEECSKHGECPDEAKHVLFDEGEEQPRAQQAPAAGKDCRPRTQEIRCRSNCVNGDCVIEYENGCKIRVQVSPRFDSFQNRFVYPAPSC